LTYAGRIVEDVGPGVGITLKTGFGFEGRPEDVVRRMPLSEEGFFEFSGLVPGVYRLLVLLPSATCSRIRS